MNMNIHLAVRIGSFSISHIMPYLVTISDSLVLSFIADKSQCNKYSEGETDLD